MSWGEMLVMFARDDLLIMGSICAGCALMSSALERRSHFGLRVALSFALGVIWMVSMQMLKTTISINRPDSVITDQILFWVSTGKYAGLFVLYALLVPMMSRASFCQSLYIITVSYSIQNLCERLIEIPRYSLANFPLLLDRFLLLLMLSACLYAYCRTCIVDARSRAMFDFSNLNNRMMLFLTSGVLIISVALDMRMRGEAQRLSMTARNCLNVMSAMFSLMAIVVSASHLRETDSERRARVAAQMLHSEQQRYEQEKRLQDAINIKCHDIRHQIAALGEGVRCEELKKIGKLVDIYDTAPRTHNAALDVVLVGKALGCHAQQITLTCMADGRRLGFIEDSDIYALFGNILDNAMDAVEKVEDPDHRLISLTVSVRDDLVLIEEENFFEGDSLDFEEGLPVTTKQERLYHGFGLRSIRTLTEKFGGDMQIEAKDGIFRLSILLPIQNSAEKTA